MPDCFILFVKIREQLSQILATTKQDLVSNAEWFYENLAKLLIDLLIMDRIIMIFSFQKYSTNLYQLTSRISQ